ncbi:MAG TPA: hypothetical protein VLG10_09845 [Methylomirabilota bacterium]|nr:hypothetical protein [Methylomirabilota bacterium]
MESRIFVGTVGGLRQVDATGAQTPEVFAGHTVTALAREGTRAWAILDGDTIWATTDDGTWAAAASVPGLPATCLAPTPAGLLVGTEQAHLFRLAGDRLTPVEPFEQAEGRATWYTPWGDPADVRSIAVGAGASAPIYVNVHVGGVLRSADGERDWHAMLDIEIDVHQVIAHPTRPGTVLVAAADGLGVSRDGGESWELTTAGLSAHYSRAVAIAGDWVLLTASTGPGGRRSAVYRRRLDEGGDLERCRHGLPEWFSRNIDTACLAAAGPVVAFGTEDGRVFRSLDAGTSWELAAKGLPEIRCLVLG